MWCRNNNANNNKANNTIISENSLRDEVVSFYVSTSLLHYTGTLWNELLVGRDIQPKCIYLNKDNFCEMAYKIFMFQVMLMTSISYEHKI